MLRNSRVALDRKLAPDRWDGGLHAPTHGLDLIDWSSVEQDAGPAIVEGLVLPGRWTVIAAPGKTGKTTLLVAITARLTLGRDAFADTDVEPVTVLYMDAEVGRLGLREVLEDCDFDPKTLERWRATDTPGLLNTPAGAAEALVTIRDVGANLVAIDGINGVVEGGENDDEPWRGLYDRFIRPLKAQNIAVLTTDNTGHEAKHRPRGTSVKIDKADMIASLARTDEGVRLSAPQLRRSSRFAAHIDLAAAGFDGSTPIRYRRVDQSWPPGTKAVADMLDELSVPVTHGVRLSRKALREAGEVNPANADYYRASSAALEGAVRWRKLGRP